MQSQLIFRQGMPPEAVYTFKHALIQDAAHESLLKSRRRVLHSDIARVLVGASAAGTDIRPEFIAQHFTEAGLLPEAVDWWATAGEQAGQRSANAEAVAHYRKAIDLLAGLPESGARTAQEVNLQVALGYAYIRQLGWAADPVAKCFARAEGLCNELGQCAAAGSGVGRHDRVLCREGRPAGRAGDRPPDARVGPQLGRHRVSARSA